MASIDACPACKALRADQTREKQMETAAVIKLRTAKATDTREIQKTIVKSRKRQVKIGLKLQEHQGTAHRA